MWGSRPLGRPWRSSRPNGRKRGQGQRTAVRLILNEILRSIIAILTERKAGIDSVCSQKLFAVALD